MVLRRFNTVTHTFNEHDGTVAISAALSHRPRADHRQSDVTNRVFTFTSLITDGILQTSP